MILVWLRFQFRQGLWLHWVVLMKHRAHWLISAWHLTGCMISSMFCLTQVFSGWTDHSKQCLFFLRGGNIKKRNRVRSKCYTRLNLQPYLIHDSFNHNIIMNPMSTLSLASSWICMAEIQRGSMKTQVLYNFWLIFMKERHCHFKA